MVDYSKSLKFYDVFQNTEHSKYLDEFNSAFIQTKLFQIFFYLWLPQFNMYMENLVFLVRYYSINLTNILPEHKCSLLHIAIDRKHFSFIEKLLDKLEMECQVNEDIINLQTKHGNTALFLLCSLDTKVTETEKYRKIFTTIVHKFKPDINQPNISGFSPILKAVTYKNKFCVEELLKQPGIDIDSNVNFYGKTARELIKEAYPELSLPEEFNLDIANKLYKLLYMRKEKEFIAFFEEENLAIYRDMHNRSMTLLGVCAHLGLFKATKYLLRKKCDVYQTCLGRNALYYSLNTRKFHYEAKQKIIFELLKAGAYFLDIPYKESIMAQHLENCVKLYEENIYLDYRSFVSLSKPTLFEKELEIFENISKDAFQEQHHPIIMCLLIMKCYKINFFRIFDTFINCFFWITLMLYFSFPSAQFYCKYIMLFLGTINAIKCVLKILFFKYGAIRENIFYLQLAVAIVTCVLPFFPLQAHDVLVSVPLTSILLSSFLLMRSIGKHHRFFIHTRMIFKVTLNYVGLFAWFMVYISSFALGFILLTTKEEQPLEPFSNLLEAIYKVFIMMTGEFNSSEIKYTSFPIVFQLFMMSFVFFLFFVLGTVLQALAITDVQSVIEEVEIYSFRSRIREIMQFHILASHLLNLFKSFPKFRGYLNGCIEHFCIARDLVYNNMEVKYSPIIVEFAESGKGFLVIRNLNSKIPLDTIVVKYIKQVVNKHVNDSDSTKNDEKCKCELVSEKHSSQLDDVMKEVQKLHSEHLAIKQTLKQLSDQFESRHLLTMQILNDISAKCSVNTSKSSS